MAAGGNAAAANATAQFASVVQHLRRLHGLVICLYRRVVPALDFAEPSTRWPETTGADATKHLNKQTLT